MLPVWLQIYGPPALISCAGIIAWTLMLNCKNNQKQLLIPLVWVIQAHWKENTNRVSGWRMG